jgi:hypothetical protein
MNAAVTSDRAIASDRRPQAIRRAMRSVTAGSVPGRRPESVTVEPHGPYAFRTLAAYTYGERGEGAAGGQLLRTLPFGPSAPGCTAGPSFVVFYARGVTCCRIRSRRGRSSPSGSGEAPALATRIEADGIALRGVVASLEKYAAKLEAR